MAIRRCLYCSQQKTRSPRKSNAIFEYLCSDCSDKLYEGAHLDPNHNRCLPGLLKRPEPIIGIPRLYKIIRVAGVDLKFECRRKSERGGTR